MSENPARDSKYLDPDYLANDGAVKIYASILESADECSLSNVIPHELFLTLIEYKSLIDEFRITLEKLNASPMAFDSHERESVAAAFKKNALERNGVIPRVSAFIDYLANCIHG